MSKIKMQIFTAKPVLGFTILCLMLLNVGFNSFPGANAHEAGTDMRPASLSVYTDPEFGFTAKYPKDWIVDSGQLVDLYTYIWEARFVAPSTAYRAIVVDVQPLGGSIRVKDWATTVLETLGYNFEELNASGIISEMSISGEQAIQVRFPSGTLISTYVISPNGFGYLISLQENGDDPAVPGGTLVTASVQKEDRAAYAMLLETFKLGKLKPKIRPLEKTQVNTLSTAIADSFRVPVDTDRRSFIYAVHPLWWVGTSPCYKVPYASLRHAGEDWAGDPGTVVRAVANGVVARYDPNYSSYPGRVVVIKHTLPDRSTIYSMYGHLGKVNVTQGQTVRKAQNIGIIFDWPGNSHVHWEMRDFADGSNLCPYSNSGYYGPGYTYPEHPDSYGYTNPSNFINSHSGLPGCPKIYGEVRLYDWTNCEEGYFPANDPGLWYLVDTFDNRADSIDIPSGWSAKLYKFASETNPSVCIKSTDTNLGDNYFNNSTPVANEATWMRVYDNSGCFGIPPSPPLLSSPVNGRYFNEGAKITLSWSSTGEEYYGEILGGPNGKIIFGWQSGTSKIIGPLPAGYTYSWRVKSRVKNVESGWSNTYAFTIRPRPPVNLSATAAACFSTDLSWTDRSDFEDGYWVFRNGKYIVSVGKNVSSYHDKILKSNTSYSYTVRAFIGSMRSFASNTASVTTMDCGLFPKVRVSESPDPLELSGGETKKVTYTFMETAGGTGKIIARTWRFYTQSGEPLSYIIGPYENNITLQPNGTVSWIGDVYLPVDVVTNAHSAGVSTIVLKTIFNGEALSSNLFSAESSLTINILATFRSLGGYDGHVLEVDELSNRGVPSIPRGRFSAWVTPAPASSIAPFSRSEQEFYPITR